MQLVAKELLDQLFGELLRRREKLSFSPGLALVWVGDDPQTAAFIRAKQAMAKKLDCQFFLHNFPSAKYQQLEAVMSGLNSRKDIQGIVLQLPLPKSVNAEKLLATLAPEKDIDNLTGSSPYQSPTPTGIISLLKFHHINPADLRTVILGAGKLVGGPLAEMFKQNNWPATVIEREAEKRVKEIRSNDLLIAATGVAGIVTPDMVQKEMTVVDGSGVDVNVELLEPLVKAITPKKGAIGPLTVHYLFENLLNTNT